MGQTKVQSQNSGLTKTQFGDFARHLALYVIGQRSNKTVMLLEELENSTEKLLSNRDVYVIHARGRHISEKEGYNVPFEKGDIEKLKVAVEKHKESCSITPLLAYVCVDDMESKKKIRIFWLTLADAESMGEDSSIEFLNCSQGGINLCYTEGTNVQRLTEIKRNNNKMNYVELQFVDYAPYKG